MFPRILLSDYEYEGRDLDICNLAIIKSLANNFTNTAITSINDLMTVIGVNPKNKEANLKTRESILRLQTLDFIIVYEDRLKTKKVSNLKPAKTYFIQPNDDYKDNFIKVFESDIERVLTTLETKHKSKVFLIYLSIVSYLYYREDWSMENKAAYPSIETIASYTGIDRRTVMKYIKHLHEAEVLFCITIKVHSKKNRNFYGRYKHKEIITREAIQEAETNNKFKDIKPVVGLV